MGMIALMIVIVTTVLWFRRAFQIRIPGNPYRFAIAWGVGCGLGLLAMMSGSTAGGWAAAFGGLFLYFISTGRQQNQTTLKVGDSIPAFTAPDAEGNTFDSAVLAGTPVIIKFFRGHW